MKAMAQSPLAIGKHMKPENSMDSGGVVCYPICVFRNRHTRIWVAGSLQLAAKGLSVHVIGTGIRPRNEFESLTTSDRNVPQH